MRLLIIGFSQAGHMGAYLASAATQLGLDYQIMDANEAEASGRFAQKFYWRMRGKRPARLANFGARVLDACENMRFDLIVTTGRAPLARSHVDGLRALGATVINYSTDDPWNPTLKAPWFLAAIPSYDVIFTPRRANLDDFRRSGVRAVHYLPFAYDPQVHRPWAGETSTDVPSDLLFVGGCDGDRLPLIGALIDAGLNLALFGGYWNRHLKTRPFWRGLADQDTIRLASSTARISLCLVRRANRDGNVMRSFEAAAIGGCILAEDTTDHRELFGPEDIAARYFSTPTELVQQARILASDGEARRRLSFRLQDRMASGGHTYADRLAAMVRLSGMEGSSHRLSVPA
jgi:spore maturation protein CgeB